MSISSGPGISPAHWPMSLEWVGLESWSDTVLIFPAQFLHEPHGVLGQYLPNIIYCIRNIKVIIWSCLGHIMVIQRANTGQVQGILLASVKVIEGQNSFNHPLGLFAVHDNQRRTRWAGNLVVTGASLWSGVLIQHGLWPIKIHNQLWASTHQPIVRVLGT